MSSTPRFFVSPDAVQGQSVVLPPDAAHHARSVLRLQAGEPLVVHDGTGTGYACILDPFPQSGKTVTATVQNENKVQTEPVLRVTIAQALPKTADKMEQVLQHGTEIGAAGFVFFPAFRSVARWDSRDKTEKRLERWRQIVQAAAEQSGRGVLPDVSYVPNPQAVVQRLLQSSPGTEGEADETPRAALVCHEVADLPLRAALADLPDNLGNLTVLIGPEGGFTNEEVALFTDAGAVSISLGPRVLRTETAALVAVSQILFARESGA